MIVSLRLSAMRGSASDKRRRQQGFTLIELSIVLTIIGLIVGGILKGQELINNARIKSQVAQIDNIKSAIYTFQDRYSYLPGDYPTPMNLGWAANNLGDGNGFIGTVQSTKNGQTTGTAAAITDSASVDGSEAVAAWAELAAANLLGGFAVAPGVAAVTATDLTIAAGGTLPAKFAGGDFLWMASFSVTPPGAKAAQVNLMVRLQSGTGVPGVAVKRPDMISLDTKYDDGLPQTGSIIVGSTSTTD
jgi:prepilin-type N-terminal cleavage/methylation domain-containing protein